MRKFIPYLYITLAVVLCIEAFTQFFQDKELYRIIFNWNTESKYVYLFAKMTFALVFMFWGLQKLKQSRSQN